MTDFAWIDAQGTPTAGGRVPDGRPLPVGAIALPLGKSCEDLARLRWIGGDWLLLPVAVTTGPSADERAERAVGEVRKARMAAADWVNRSVDRARRQFQTDILGQPEIYAEKRAEAAAYVSCVAGGEAAPDLAAFPRMQAEIGITAETPWQLAQVWLWKSDAALAFRDASEPLRLRGLADIASAPDLEAVEAAKWAFATSLQSLQTPEPEL